MKSRIIVVLLFISCIGFSQNGINYKAVIKDNNGNIVTNGLIVMQFSILQGVAETIVYQEIHTPTTTNNGVVIVNIGEGTPLNGVYNEIDWGSGIYSLNLQVNTGGGLIDVGTTIFKPVPFAFHAETASNVSGLEVLDEGNGQGWRIISRDSNNYGNIGNYAVDFSFNDMVSSTNGATGEYSTATGHSTTASGQLSTAMGFSTEAYGQASTAMGINTLASGPQATAMGINTIASGGSSIAMGQGTTASSIVSTAMGGNTTASGGHSTAMGENTTASGTRSTALGFNTLASGSISTALGNYTTAPSFVETVLGRYNTTYIPNNSNAWDSEDRLFVVGNGINPNIESNAITIFKNGNVALGNITPTTSNTENILDVNGRVRLRKKGSATAGIWYGTESNDNNQFAGVKSHDAIFAANREWGIYINGWRFWVNGNGDATLAGNLSQNSDKRLKKNITDLPYGLKEIIQLQPKIYNWIHKEQQHKSLGLIAQEVQPIISEIVSKQDDENKTLSLSYIELIPVLIKAIQEQQEIIEQQNTKIEVKSLNKTKTDKTLQALVKRIEILENLKSN